MTELNEGDDETSILPKQEKIQRRLHDPPVLPDLNKIPSLVEFVGKKVVIDLNQLALEDNPWAEEEAKMAFKIQPKRRSKRLAK